MNQDERRALKLLQQKDVPVSEEEFRKWCTTNKHSTLTPEAIALRWMER